MSRWISSRICCSHFPSPPRGSASILPTNHHHPMPYAAIFPPPVDASCCGSASTTIVRIIIIAREAEGPPACRPILIAAKNQAPGGFI